MKKYKYDRIWGVERNEASKDYGRIVVGGEDTMPVVLWSRPGAKLEASNVTGALKHDDSVRVIRTVTYNGAEWARVSKTVMHEGQKYMQKGWLSVRLLKKAGESVSK